MCLSVELLANIMTFLTIVAWVGIPAYLTWWLIKRFF